jgi:8-oxo-dGTP diphosphatase
VGSASVVYLVRHAKAGERRVWEADDEIRPLSNKGWRQAEALAVRLDRRVAGRPVDLVSSPYVRCVQTLEPLAMRLDTKITIDERLAEGQSFEGALDLLADVSDGAVLCSHGDVIPETIQALARRGMEVQGPPDWRKATVWVLKRKGDLITKGKVWPPPA